MPETYPHLIFHNFGGNIGTRVQTILSALFPPSKPDSTRAITFANDGGDCIGFRHHTFEMPTKATKNRADVNADDVKLYEQGPRFNMQLYRLELGTLDMPDVKTEWVLRPHFNKQRSTWIRTAGASVPFYNFTKIFSPASVPTFNLPPLSEGQQQDVQPQQQQPPQATTLTMPPESPLDGGYEQLHLDPLFPVFPSSIHTEEMPVMESPVPVPLFPNPELIHEAARLSNEVDLIALTTAGNGGSSSTSPRSRASSSSKGSSKTRRASNNKGKCAYPLGCNKYRQNGTRFCVKHGGVRRCAVPGCPNAAKRGDTTKAVSRKDSTASTASGSGSEESLVDQGLQLCTMSPSAPCDASGVDLQVPGLTASHLDYPYWGSSSAAGEGDPNLASLNFLGVSDEKWTSFVKPMEPLPELLTNHIDPDAPGKLNLF
ncbi:snoRNA-binding rRNA-processing protein imp4 [Perkinsus olseni]|uniref:SnoRNA-binding rRNA-processing protein imp4 n=1 Tax=Perkinsus olseni TaxID=32597 RepID=A0A7J6M9Y8_PEROL|nr:snoRNA-binding rRNA-processing protein imp4 [Perkinsus olseni]